MATTLAALTAPIRSDVAVIANELIASTAIQDQSYRPGCFSHWSHYCLGGGSLLSLINGIALAVLGVYVAAVICGILVITQLFGLYFLKKFTVLKNQEELSELISKKAAELLNADRKINNVHDKLSLDVKQYKDKLELEKKRSDELATQLKNQIEAFEKASKDSGAFNLIKQSALIEKIKKFMTENGSLASNIGDLSKVGLDVEAEVKESNRFADLIVNLEREFIVASEQASGAELGLEHVLKDLIGIFARTAKERCAFQEQVIKLSNAVAMAQDETKALQASTILLSETTDHLKLMTGSDAKILAITEAALDGNATLIENR